MALKTIIDKKTSRLLITGEELKSLSKEVKKIQSGLILLLRVMEGKKPISDLEKYRFSFT